MGKFFQELRCKEDELKQKQIEHRKEEQKLKKRQEELEARELELLHRELQIRIEESTPKPQKRRGKFSKSKLKVNIFATFVFHQNG